MDANDDPDVQKLASLAQQMGLKAFLQMMEEFEIGFSKGCYLVPESEAMDEIGELEPGEVEEEVSVQEVMMQEEEEDEEEQIEANELETPLSGFCFSSL